MVNIFKAFLATKLDAGGSETTVVLDRITTLTGETISTSEFATLGRGVITVNPDGDGNISYPEYISFTSISGLTLTGANRGLSSLGNSVVAENKRFHPVGTPVVISFGVHNVLDLLSYIDSQVAALTVGTANVSIATCGEDVTAGQLVYLKNDGKWWKVDADTASTVDGVQLGIAQGAGSTDGDITNGVMLKGLDTNQFGLVSGTTYYASNTAGGISSSAGTTSKVIGVAKSATSIYFDPNYSTGQLTAAQKTQVTQFAVPGIISPYAGRTAPTGWLICDGSDVSRTTYADLLAVIAPSQTCTGATNDEITATAHGLVAGDKIHFTTTGTLPAGLSTNTDYYVISSGLTTDVFKVALTPAGTVVDITNTGTGTHTVYKSSFGKGDGSTTFTLPDLRSKVPVGRGASAPTQTLTFSGAQRSGNAITILDTVFPAQGQAVVLSTTGALPTGLSPGTYYIIRVSSTSISFATSQANANAGTAVSLSGDGSGINTMTFTNRAHTVLGRQGGEETHGTSITELAAHTHTPLSPGTTFYTIGGSANANSGSGSLSYTFGDTTGSTGGDNPHNNMQPFTILNYIIKT